MITFLGISFTLFISEKLSEYVSTIDSSSENTMQNAVTLVEIPSNALDHNYSIPNSPTTGQKFVVHPIYVNFVTVSIKFLKNSTF